jgi:hypothetical protein
MQDTLFKTFGDFFLWHVLWNGIANEGLCSTEFISQAWHSMNNKG